MPLRGTAMPLRRFAMPPRGIVMPREGRPMSGAGPLMRRCGVVAPAGAVAKAPLAFTVPPRGWAAPGTRVFTPRTYPDP